MKTLVVMAVLMSALPIIVQEVEQAATFQAMDRVTITFPRGSTNQGVIVEVGEIGTFRMPIDPSPMTSRVYGVVIIINGESGVYRIPEFAMTLWVDPEEDK